MSEHQGPSIPDDAENDLAKQDMSTSPADELTGDGVTDGAQCSAEGEVALPESVVDNRSRGSILEVLVLVLLAMVLALFLKTYVAEAYEIKGRSMEPTLHNGERVVVLKIGYELERGSIIIFSSKSDPSKDLIKRVIGLPGDTVHIEDGVVFVNGERLKEDYLMLDGRESYEEPLTVRIGEGEYFVLGDNRNDSHDSRRFQGVPEASIKGEVIVRWWPFGQMSAF